MRSNAHNFNGPVIASRLIRSIFVALAMLATSATSSAAITFLDADFDSGDDGFTYADDTFRSGSAPNYASGSHLPAGGETGGGLQVLLGNIDNSQINFMSGGHRQTFTLTVLTDVDITFRYHLQQESDYESDEFSQVMVSLDSVPLAGIGPDYVDQVTGDGNGGSPITTGWQSYAINLPSMAPGTYTLTIGGYNNKKTADNELTTVLIDEVLVTGDPASMCSVPADCNDSNVCTDDICNAGVCENPPNTATCDDGISCTNDICGGGVCLGTDNCTGGATCNLVTDMCELPASNPLVAALDLQTYIDHVENLSTSDPPFNGTRFWNQPGNEEALDYIEAEFISYGYTVERHAYTYQSTTKENIYATKVGTLVPEEMIMVTAHLDSFNNQDSSGLFAPGANDDASGVSLILEAARVFGGPAVTTDTSIRFILWNNHEQGSVGSSEYANDRELLQGIEDPVSSGIYPEPTWLGLIQHDMMLFDHGLPPGPSQLPAADVDVEYLGGSGKSAESLALANLLAQANLDYASNYPAEVSDRMCCTDSNVFINKTAAISVRENRRSLEIEHGSNPHHHEPTDVFATYSAADFLLGFNALQTTVGAVADMVNAQLATTCGDTVLDVGEQCDDGNQLSGDCCSAICMIEASGTVCRAAAGLCDAPETCDGIADSCPVADLKLVSECRADVGVCDVADFCDGVGDNCPADVVESAATSCGAVAGVCDVEDFCDGVGPACPADAKSTSECRVSAGVCDVADFCDGVADDCPADAVETAATLCRTAAGGCDVADFCDGVSDDCPADQLETSAVECRAVAGMCDVAENCSGADPNCPTDVVLDGTLCDDGDSCTTDDLCATGTCAPGATPLNCDDFDECTADSCDSLSGCAHDPILECTPFAEVPTMSLPARIVLVAIFLMVAQALISVRRVRRS